MMWMIADAASKKPKNREAARRLERARNANIPLARMGPHGVTILFQIAVLLFAISLHEAAHAWMASRLGDQTARMLGRVTLNPIKHIDPIGGVLFPLAVL